MDQTSPLLLVALCNLKSLAQKNLYDGVIEKLTMERDHRCNREGTGSSASLHVFREISTMSVLMFALCCWQDIMNSDPAQSLSPEEMVQLFDDFCMHK